MVMMLPWMGIDSANLTQRSQTRQTYPALSQLYDGTMAHCVWWFALALPNPLQRISKILQVPFIPLVPAQHAQRDIFTKQIAVLSFEMLPVVLHDGTNRFSMNTKTMRMMVCFVTL